MASFTRVKARATIHHGAMVSGIHQVLVVDRGEEIELETADAERLHRLRLADIIGEPTEKLPDPPPLQNTRGKKSTSPEIIDAGFGETNPV